LPVKSSPAAAAAPTIANPTGGSGTPLPFFSTLIPQILNIPFVDPCRACPGSHVAAKCFLAIGRLLAWLFLEGKVVGGQDRD